MRKLLTMKNIFKTFIFLFTTIFLTNCSRVKPIGSEFTSLIFSNSKKVKNINNKFFKGNETPEGMVLVEGGTFMMGQVKDNPMFDWNTSPKKIQVGSFYMDETEVTNLEYLSYVKYIKNVFPPSEEKYKYIYSSVLPDTLAWGTTLSNTGVLSDKYFRHPAYSNYPVVGVSWLQANEYCKWRTNILNLKTLIDKGYIENIFEIDTISNFFDTDVFLSNDSLLFNGNKSIYKKGVPYNLRKRRDEKIVNRKSFKGRKITQSDGILFEKFRLPTEAEWEFAAKGNINKKNRKSRTKYPWNKKSNKLKNNNQLANFKQGKVNTSFSSDGASITNKVKSYSPNNFGLYDMDGNVSEWVADVYRPIIDTDANDFYYYRGNLFNKKMIDSEGNLVYSAIGDNTKLEYDTLPNGKIVPKHLPGTIKLIPITKNDAIYRANYSLYNNTSINDGDFKSSIHFDKNMDRNGAKNLMYNSPKPPKPVFDSVNKKIRLIIDDKKRTTLINDKSRVYKGGSWVDRIYWLDPAQRRYLPEYMSKKFIGFRCVLDKLGPMSNK